MVFLPRYKPVSYLYGVPKPQVSILSICKILTVALSQLIGPSPKHHISADKWIYLSYRFRTVFFFISTNVALDKRQGMGSKPIPLVGFSQVHVRLN
jgi:hypothetical protein